MRQKRDKMRTDCSFLETHAFTDQSDSFQQQLKAITIILVVLCLPTIVLNFLIWVTVIAKRHFHRPSYLIIANLALSDLLVGCISFPIYAVTCYMQSIGRDTCFIDFIVAPIAYTLGLATCLTVSFQAIERFIAIFYPFQYRTRVTKSVVIIINLIIWLVSCCAIIFWMLSRKTQVFNTFIGTIVSTFSLVDIFCYYKIFFKTKEIENQIANQANFTRGDKESRPRLESKVTRVTAMVLINVFLCHTPSFGYHLHSSLSRDKSIEGFYFLHWALMLGLVNSFINPLIAYLQLSVIRKAVFDKFTLFESCVSHIQSQ